MTSTAFRRRQLVAALGVAAALLPALANAAQAVTAAAPSYVLLSVVGDKLGLVWQRPGTASNLDKNEHRDLPVKDLTFESASVFAAADTVQALQPGAKTTMLSTKEPALYREAEQLPGDAAAELLGPVKEAIDKTQATRLVLVTKYRQAARLKLREGLVGTGRLNGIGFYIDETYEIDRGENLQGAVGFVAPYAYVTVSLIDVRTMKVLKKSSVIESAAMTSARSKSANTPWDALTPEEKVESLKGVLQAAVARGVTEVLSGS